MTVHNVCDNQRVRFDEGEDPIRFSVRAEAWVNYHCPPSVFAESHVAVSVEATHREYSHYHWYKAREKQDMDVIKGFPSVADSIGLCGLLRGRIRTGLLRSVF